MAIDNNAHIINHDTPEGRSPLKGVCGLLAAVAGILFFMFIVGPWLDQLPMIRPLAQFIDERDIDANMYFYTEVEEFSEANMNMQNTMDYPPQLPLPPQ